jgi:translation elongation factor EF-Tu-like GTPase
VRAASDVPAAAPVVRLSAEGAIDERQLKERILVDLQQQIDAVIEYRMREVLTPILTRATDSIVRDARAELSRSLRTLIDQSVAQELRRQRRH